MIFEYPLVSRKEDSMRETGRYGFKAFLVKELEELFPGCILLNNDPNDTQGIPDLLILFEDKWAALETKGYKNARRQPNQPWYVDKMNSMSFAAFIEPDNKEEVLNELQRTFRNTR